MNSDNSKEQDAHHHERAIIRAFMVVGLVIVLGALMAYYTFKIFSGGGIEKKADETRAYNGFEFARNGNFWSTEWQRDDGVPFTLEFRHPPWDVENITVSGRADARFQLSHMFVTFDPTDEPTRSTAFVALAAADLTTMLRGVFEREGVAPACTSNVTEACRNRPVVTCSTNASVIYLKVSNGTGVFLDGNCATIKGFEENLTKSADKVIYQWLGIVKK